MFKTCHSLPILSTYISCGYFLSDSFSQTVIIYFLCVTFSPAATPRHVSQGMLLHHCFLHFVYMVLLTMNLELRLFSQNCLQRQITKNQNSAGWSSLHLSAGDVTSLSSGPPSSTSPMCVCTMDARPCESKLTRRRLQRMVEASFNAFHTPLC